MSRLILTYSAFSSFFPTFHGRTRVGHRRPDPTGEAAARWEVGALHGTVGAQVHASALAARCFPARASQRSLSSTSAIHRETSGTSPPAECQRTVTHVHAAQAVQIPYGRCVKAAGPTSIILLCRTQPRIAVLPHDGFQGCRWTACCAHIQVFKTRPGR